MNLIEKYLGEVKYTPNMKFDPEKYDSTSIIDALEQVAKVMKGKEGDITANIVWAMKSNDKKRLKL